MEQNKKSENDVQRWAAMQNNLEHAMLGSHIIEDADSNTESDQYLDMYDLDYKNSNPGNIDSSNGNLVGNANIADLPNYAAGNPQLAFQNQFKISNAKGPFKNSTWNDSNNDYANTNLERKRKPADTFEGNASPETRRPQKDSQSFINELSNSHTTAVLPSDDFFADVESDQRDSDEKLVTIKVANSKLKSLLSNDFNNPMIADDSNRIQTQHPHTHRGKIDINSLIDLDTDSQIHNPWSLSSKINLTETHESEAKDAKVKEEESSSNHATPSTLEQNLVPSFSTPQPSSSHDNSQQVHDTGVSSVSKIANTELPNPELGGDVSEMKFSSATELTKVPFDHDIHTIKISDKQKAIIQDHNKRVRVKFDKQRIQSQEDLPDFVQLSNSGMPSVPSGFLPLIMAPNGSIYPMDIINVSPDKKTFTIVKPLWDMESNASPDKKTDDNGAETPYDESETPDEMFGPDIDTSGIAKQKTRLDKQNEYVDSLFTIEGFDIEDKLGSMHLFLLSQDCKTVISIGEKAHSFGKYNKQIKYYNDLIGREKIEFINSYASIKQKYENMLNQINDNSHMVDFEKDLLEMRDYQILYEKTLNSYKVNFAKREYLERVIEMQSIQCLEYTSRLNKLKNYLRMEHERLNKNRNKLCRINNNKSSSIWKKFNKSSSKRSKNILPPQIESSFLPSYEFLQLTNGNSRTYLTYVLNNSLDKGNEFQEEIVDLVDYFLPNTSILKQLYYEVQKGNKRKNIKTIFKTTKKEGGFNGGSNLLSAGDVGSGGNDSSRILKSLKIDASTGNPVRRGRGRPREKDRVLVETSDGKDTTTNNGTNGTNNINEKGRFKLRRTTNNKLDESTDTDDATSASSGNIVSKTGSRNNELNITSIFDKTLSCVDRVKMFNLDESDIRNSFTKLYGMPQGLRREEIDQDLEYLRKMKDTSFLCS